MELGEFITKTLTEISTAMAEFEASEKNPGMSVFPELYSSGDASATVGLITGKDESGNQVTVMPMNFEVSVSVVDGSIKMAEGGLSIPGLGGAEAKGQETDKTVSVNRLTFSVPLQLPLNEAKNEANKERKRKTAERRKQPIRHKGGGGFVERF